MKISFWKHHPISDQTGVQLAKEAIEFQEKFNFDFLKLTPAGNWLSVSYGIKDDLWENDILGRRKIIGYALNELSDFYNLPIFTLKEPIIAEILTAIKICSQSVQVPVFATVFCPISQLIQISGLELFLKTAKEDPNAIHKALEVITLNTNNVLKAISNNGSTGLYFVSQHMNNQMLSITEYENFGNKYDKECLEFAATLFKETYFHLHGEDCYACIQGNIPNLTLHCAYYYEETSNSKTIKNSGYPIIFGLSFSELEKVNSTFECLDLIKKYEIKETLTCDCVLPLQFSDEKIYIWKESLNHFKSEF